MKLRKFTMRQLAKRGAALLLAALTAAALFPCKTAYADDDQESIFNTMTVYRWHRVKSQDTLPTIKDCDAAANGRIPALIFWKSGGTIYYGTGSDGGGAKSHGEDAMIGKTWVTSPFKPDPFDNSTDCDMFYSTSPLTEWRIRMSEGTDRANGSKRCYLWFGSALINGFDDWDWKWGWDWKDDKGKARDHPSCFCWTIHTKDGKGKYSDGMDANRIKMYMEIDDGTDTGVFSDGQYIYAESNRTYKYSQFVMYWAEPVTYSTITEDYTICEGMVMNVDDGVMLKDGVTLTVNPGGVLSIEGEFFNNGKIVNHGTIVLQKDACITSFAPETDEAGTIVNTGGVINVADLVNRQIDESKVTMAELREKLDKTLPVELKAAEDALTEAEQDVTNKLNEVQPEELNGEIRYMRKLGSILDELESQVEQAYQDLAEYKEYVSKLSDIILITDPLELEEKINEKLEEYIEDSIAPLMDEIDEWENKEGPEIEGVEGRTPSLNALRAVVGERTEALLAVQAEVTATQKRYDSVKANYEYLTRYLASGRAVSSRGEGNLLLLENARLTFKDADRTYLIFQEGAGMVCNGYVLAPAGIDLIDSKIHIRSKGAVICEYVLSKNIYGFKNAEVRNQGTTSVMFGSMTECKNVDHCISASGDYRIVVDGVLRYDDSPVYDVTQKQNVDIKEGRGVWTTTNAPNKYTTDKNGNTVEIDSQGNTILHRADGTVIYTSAKTRVVTELRPDGTKIVTQPNGSSVETREDGSIICRYADGSIQSATVYHSDGSVGEFDKKLNAIVTKWTSPNANGAIMRYDYDNGRYTNFMADGTVIYYSAEGYVERIDNPADSDEPAEEPTEPVEEPAEPAEEPDEPTEEPAEPTEEPDEPAEEPAEPTEEPEENATT